MKNKSTRSFQVQIWFDDLRGKTLLGTVSVYAETETQALKLAQENTQYFVSGVDETSWEVREPVATYA